MKERLRRSEQDSDVTFFYDLMSAGELALKLQVAAIVAAVNRDPDQIQFALESRLVRADGVGEWAAVMDDLLSGSASTFVDPAARPAQRELTETVVADDWRPRVLHVLKQAIELVDPAPPLYRRAQLRQWVHYFAALRNKEKAHGAPDASTCGHLASLLAEAIGLLFTNSIVFAWPWANVRRTLAGSYRVSELNADTTAFATLRKRTDFALDDGIYLDVGGLRPVRLVATDVELSDFFVANGGFAASKYERLSYITGKRENVDHGRYARLPAPVSPSETRGLESVSVRGEVLTNMPERPSAYVSRAELEERLCTLLTNDRHPIITLSGRGGIGKTSLALEVLHQLTNRTEFDAIWWFSARDIDLLPEGPKQVRPDVADLTEMSHQFAALTVPALELKREGAVDHLRSAMSDPKTAGRSLFVFDNFETVVSPSGLYEWLDNCIRLPNKILVTTRVRNFKADYPIEVGGMTREEFRKLVFGVSETLAIRGTITDKYIEELYSESGGHPYVAKILLGEVARTGKVGSVERIMASSDQILTALFERTFSSSLSPAAQRVFLTLSGWRSVIPEVAVKAALLRPGKERLDVDHAIEELLRSSMVESYEGPDESRFLRVPLAAQLFGASKLRVSADKVSIDSDIALLRAFGAARESDVGRGLEPRVKALLREIAAGPPDESAVESLWPVLEFVANQYAPAWLGIAQLRRQGGDMQGESDALRRYLQVRPADAEVWRRLARNAMARGDVAAELNALLQFAALPSTEYRDISDLANRINGYLRDQLVEDREDRSRIAGRVRALMENRLDEADATDLSRLGWLCVNLQDVDAAHEYARRGLSKDPSNAHCEKLSRVSPFGR